MIQILKKLFDFLTPQERRQGLLLLFMTLVMALLDVIGVASILPFVAVLARPELVETNYVLARINTTLGFNDPQDFLFFLGAAVFVILLISIAFKALTTYAQLRFTLMREYSISRHLVAGYLHQSYAWFLNRNSADLAKTVLSEVAVVVHGAIRPAMTLISHVPVVLALLVLLLVVDPQLSVSVAGVLGLAYGLTYRLMRGYLARIGADRLKGNEMRFTVLGEAFGGIKAVKVAGLEDTFINRFEVPARTFAAHQASSQAAAQLPRFVLEALVFGGMLLLLLYLMANEEGLAEVLPIISLYIFAGYRLMPALQAVYASITQLRFTSAAVDALHLDLSKLASHQKLSECGAKIHLHKSISLQSITYTYPQAEQPVLQDFNLVIPAGSTIGLVGSTGSGKTTAVDLILGLLEPGEGTITVDGVVIGPSNLRQWQRNIGYVPQHIYLADDTLTANIAFGVAKEHVDQRSVERCSRIANLHDFVMNELPQGYATITGERGVRLSGGQRQRIGIARALYHNPQVLILDEATSALDNLTEQAVMDAVNQLGHEITIIIVAHRLTTVRKCDQIYILDRGCVAGQGCYDELVDENETFRAMTKL
ncbi:MAG: ABC transporter ATP-binding protein/permease [Candidatus Berkelbacteria bacterium]|nr:ABC transporter ATP-binding protein/permease [Candidatus Berkelbacteria bacterium]